MFRPGENSTKPLAPNWKNLTIASLTQAVRKTSDYEKFMWMLKKVLLLYIRVLSKNQKHRHDLAQFNCCWLVIYKTTVSAILKCIWEYMVTVKNKLLY